MARERLIFTTRPDGTPLWLPELMAHHLKIKERARLTNGQFESEEVQSLLFRRLDAEKSSRKK